MLKKEGKYIFMSRQRQNYKKAWCDEVLENAKTHLGAQIATINSLFILSVGGSQCVCASWWKKIVIWYQKISFKASNCQWSGSEINSWSQILTLIPCNVKYVVHQESGQFLCAFENVRPISRSFCLLELNFQPFVKLVYGKPKTEWL